MNKEQSQQNNTKVTPIKMTKEQREKFEKDLQGLISSLNDPN